MKYHINPESGKVSSCRAKVKCRFGGESGSDNHFTSRSVAEAEAEKLMGANHDFKGLQKPRQKAVGQTSFDATRSNIRAGLAKAGLASGTLPPVSTEDEIVEKWFGGDRKKYELIARISGSKSGLTAATRSSVSGFVKKGAAVGFVPDLESLSEAKKSGASTEVSEVDLMDETPNVKASVQDILSGRVRAF